MARLPANLVIVGFVSLLADLSTEMVYPLLPVFLVGLGATGLAFGVMEGGAESVSSFLKYASGRRSDRTQGRKGLTIIGYGLSAVVKFGFPFAANAAQVVALRVGDRFGKGIRGAPRDALIADSMPKQRWGFAYGFHRALDTVGALLGPFIGLVLIATLTLQQVFLVAAIPAAVGAALLLLLRERAPGTPRPVKHERFPHSAMLHSYLLTVAVFTLGNFGLAFLLLRAATLGLPAADLLLIYGVYNLVYAALAFPAGALTDRIGRAPVLLAGIIAAAAANFAILEAHPSGLLGFLAWVPIFGVSSAAFEGTGRALAVDQAPARARATVLGAYHATIGVAALPAGLLMGLLFERDPSLVFATSGLLALAAGAELTLLWRQGLGKRTRSRAPVALLR